MLIIANVLEGIAFVLDSLLTFMIILIFVRAVVSWFNPDPYNAAMRFLVGATEPLLRPLRRFIPPLGGSIDLTPLILFLLLYFIKIALVQTVHDYSRKLRMEALTSGLVQLDSVFKGQTF